jgi:hypothetical protein
MLMCPNGDYDQPGAQTHIQTAEINLWRGDNFCMLRDQDHIIRESTLPAAKRSFTC